MLHLRQLILVSAALLSPVLCCAQDGQSTLAQRLLKIRQSQQSGAQTSARDVSSNEIYARMLKSVALIYCTAGEESWTGTGWVLDAEQRLLVTNQHVTEGTTYCEVYFPELSSGKLITDPESSIRPERSHWAKVIDSDPNYDLALVQLEDDLPQDVVALELADSSASPGEQIHSIAGSTVGSQSLWIYSTGHVRQVVDGIMANGREASVLESNMATNQGNSGGPVCNDQGQVVAVVEGHRNDARLVSIYVNLTSLAEYLADGLRCVDPQSLEDLQFSAFRHYNDSRYDESLKLATKALKQEESAEMYDLRGWCWYWKDDYDNATAEFEEALRVDRTFAETHSGLGCIAADIEDYEAAVKHFTNAMRNAPEVATYPKLRGDMKYNLDDLPGARKDLQAALRITPDYIAARQKLGIVEVSLGNYQEGLDCINQTIDSFLDDYETFFYAAVAYQRLEQLDNALVCFQKAIELEPAYLPAYTGVAQVLIDSNREEEAIPYLLTAIESDDTISTNYLVLGVGLMELGRVEEAIEALQQASALEPEDGGIGEQARTMISQVRSGKDNGNQYVHSAANSPTYVSQNSDASSSTLTEFVGKWVAQIRENGELLQMQLALHTNGRYQMRMITVTNQGEREDMTDSGTYSIVGNEIHRTSDNDQTSHTHPVKWHNQDLLLYLDGFDSWVSFSKYH